MHLENDENINPEPHAPLTDRTAEESPGMELKAPIEALKQQVARVKKELSKVIIGQESVIENMLIALFSGGHVLLEGVPGIAKTLTAKMLSKSLQLQFSRIQFTPDLMPTDVLGTTIFNMKTSEFNFSQGPIFSNVVLIDEINRAPAKTQAALFEVMEEQQITIDGTTYQMPQPFFVLATQNPIEQEGTYRLPEAQLDRFMFRIIMDYPSLEEEKLILHQFKNDFRASITTDVQPVLDFKTIRDCQQIIERIYIKDELIDHIANIIYHTRINKDLYLGASPRASLSILKAAKAKAALHGRYFVTPDDIHDVTNLVLNHRIMLTPEVEMESKTTKDIIEAILEKIEIPR